MSSEGIDVFRYDQQSCLWSSYGNSEWSFYSENRPITATECSQACYNNTHCTGFELSQSGYDNSPYCAFWFDGACYVPDGYVGFYYDVTTYSLVSRQPPYSWYDFAYRFWFHIMIIVIVVMICGITCCVGRRCAKNKHQKRRAITFVEKVESDEPIVVASPV
jgi:hypothetical protein